MEFREQITIGFVFFIFAYFASLGFWQLIAAWQRLRAFSWLPRSASGRWGYLLGSTIIASASVWFFGTRSEEIFSPGPASSEFLFFLSGGLFCALATTIFASFLVHKLAAVARGDSENPSPERQAVSIKWWQAAIYLPSSGNRPYATICIVPEPGEGIESLDRMAAWFCREGIAALAIDMSSDDSWRYPDVLGAIPQAMAYLEERDELDASRVGLMGVGLGADLVIRATASDPQIRAVVAIAPLLVASGVQPGLDLLGEMSYPGAVRWSRMHRGGDSVRRVGALEYVSRLGSRPSLIIHGEQDRLVPFMQHDVQGSGVELKVISGHGRRGLADDGRVIFLVTSWFHKHL